MSESYRSSHLEKGRDYHDTFSQQPHRAMQWRMEQGLLADVVGRHFRHRAPTYLDFACGTGRILAHVSLFAASATGVDVSPSMLSVARERVPSAEFIEADLTRDDPLGSRKFDLITAFRFFPNAEYELRTAAMAVLVRHLDPAGCLIFNNHKHDRSSARRIAARLRRIPEGGKALSDRVMSKREVSELVEGAGLRIVREEPIGCLPFTDNHMLRPVLMLEAIERAIRHLPGSRSVAQNLIYVCCGPN